MYIQSYEERLNWNEKFLNEVDFGDLYDKYINSEGYIITKECNTDDIKRFAEYVTHNAPISTNWKELFEKDLYDTYGYKVVKYEDLEDNLYQAYVKVDNKVIPYVVVSARTGNFHG